MPGFAHTHERESFSHLELRTGLFLVGYLNSDNSLLPVLWSTRLSDAARRTLVRKLNHLGLPILADLPPIGASGFAERK